MVTKPLGGAAELVANTGEGLLTGAGWVLSPQPLDAPNGQVIRSDTKIRYTEFFDLVFSTIHIF